MIALHAAVEAGEKIMEFYTNGFETKIKEDGSPVTQADLASSAIISSYLETTSIPITGEERKETAYSERKKWERSWCVDPLDGTKEFIKKNGEFAINIALIIKDKPVFGLIASPVERRILFGGNETGIFITDFKNIQDSAKWESIPKPAKTNYPLTITCSRSHDSGFVLEFLNKIRLKYPEIEFIKKGSALKFFDLALGKADVYPRFAPTMEWDIAAGQAILEALGGSVLDAQTRKPLIYNKEDLRNPYFIGFSYAFLNNL